MNEVTQRIQNLTRKRLQLALIIKKSSFLFLKKVIIKLKNKIITILTVLGMIINNCIQFIYQKI